MFEACSVVGAGHDLMCGAMKGDEIDSATAVFRANAAQASEISNPTLFNTTPFKSDLASLLAQRRGDARRFGRRTDIRVNCLFSSRAVSTDELCVISHAWWARQWGKEDFENTRRKCCDPAAYQAIKSSYRTSQILNQSREGFPFAFFAGGVIDTGDPSLDSLAKGSGGNALQAALSLCTNVSLYGFGLHSNGPTEAKRYMHSYDPPGLCDREPFTYSHEGTAGIFRAWRTDRVRNELLLHILHALGVLRWAQ